MHWTLGPPPLALQTGAPLQKCMCNTQADKEGGSDSESGSDEEDGSGSEDMDEDTPAAPPPPRHPPPQVTQAIGTMPDARRVLGWPQEFVVFQAGRRHLYVMELVALRNAAQLAPVFSQCCAPTLQVLCRWTMTASRWCSGGLEDDRWQLCRPNKQMARQRQQSAATFIDRDGVSCVLIGQRSKACCTCLVCRQ